MSKSYLRLAAVMRCKPGMFIVSPLHRRVQVAKLLHRSTLFFRQGSLQVRGQQRLSCCILPACTLP
jgi:hypothetical protein